MHATLGAAISAADCRIWPTFCLDMMRSKGTRWFLPLVILMAAAGCDALTDPATRIAYDIEVGAGKLGKEQGARYSVQHTTPSAAGQCAGPYTVQIDKVGALIIWCKDESGKTVSSHSTSYHARFADAPQTWILDKPAGSTLVIDIERRASRAVIFGVR